jgi:GTP cyclohydrolase III
MRKGISKGEEHNELPRDPLRRRSSLSSPHRSSPTQLHCVKTLNTSNHRHGRWEKRAAPRAAASATKEIRRTGLSVQDQSTSNNYTLNMATLVQQITTELSEIVSEKDKILVITRMVLNLMKQNGY